MHKIQAISSNDARFAAAQALIQAMLSVVDRLCRHHNLNYALFFDSLRSAVCQRNFSAGSENAHLVLQRDDYEQLLALLADLKAYPRLGLELPGGEEGSVRPYARLYCRNTDVHRVPELPLHNHFFPVSLSILPLDTVAATEEKQIRRLKRIRAWTAALNLKGPSVDSVSEVGRSGDGSQELHSTYTNAGPEAAVSVAEVWLKSLLPKRWAIRRRDALMRGGKADRGEDFAIYMPMSGLIAVSYGKTQQVFPTATIPLGKRAYSCPGKAHEVLLDLYGDYRCEVPTNSRFDYAAFDIDTAYWADVIYAEDPADVL